MNKLYIEVTVDTNDADYASKRNEISEDKLIKLKEILEKVKRDYFNNISWGIYDCMGDHNNPKLLYNLSEEEVDFVEGYCPHPEWGFHSIESIKLLEVVREEELI